MKGSYRLFFSLSLALCFFVPPVGADATKMGVVDVKKLQSVSKRFQTTRAQLQKKVDDLQKKLDEQREDLLKVEAEFQKQSLMLSLDAQVDKQSELKKKMLYLEYLYKDYTEQMKDAEMEAAQKLGLELQDIVKKIAEKEGYLLVFEKGAPGLIVYDDVIEITDKVIQAYDSGQ